MPQQRAEVIEGPEGAWMLQVECSSGCQACRVQKVCQGQTRSIQLPMHLVADQPDHHKPFYAGQQLLLEVDDSEVLRLTLIAYLLPCLLLVGGAVLASPLGNLATALGAIVGLIAGVLAGSLLTLDKPPRITLLADQPASHTEPVHDLSH